MKHTEINELLVQLGASQRLVRHLEIVTEVASQLVDVMESLGVPLDRELVLAGAAAHDAGKIEYPAELDGPGSRHEEAGRALLLRNRVPPSIADCAVSHANWNNDTPLEALIVALADKLWKGARRPDIELAVARSAADRAALDSWSLIDQIDEASSRIAGLAQERLTRSRT